MPNNISRLQFSPPIKCSRESDLIRVFKIRADGHSTGNSGHTYTQWADQAMNVQRCGFAFHTGAGGDDDLFNIARQASEEFPDVDVSGANAVEWGEESMQNMVTATKLSGALNGQEPWHILHNTDDLIVATGVTAELARILFGEIEAVGAFTNACLYLYQRRGKLFSETCVGLI